MRSRSRKCQWCEREASRWRGVVCNRCEERTKGTTLYALLYEDRSAISSLHEVLADAQAILKDDAAHGLYCQILRKVTGQAGARAELNESRSPNQEMWDRMEAAANVAEFEATTS